MTNERQLRPLGDTLGTEALGIDLSKTLDAAEFDWIARAFAVHPVLVFREQNLTATELAATEPRSAGASARRASMRWSSTATPSIRMSRG